MNLADYTTLVQTEVEDTSDRAKSVIERAIKDTYQEIVGFTIDELVGITDEDITATLNQRYVDTVNVYQDFKNVMYKPATSSDFVSLTPISEEDYYDRFVNRDPADPMHFYLKNNRVYFELATKDAGTVKIAGMEVQDELTGSVVSVIPDRFTQVVVKGAVAHFKAYEGTQDAREYFKIYRGSYFEQGKIGGSLKNMIEQLRTKTSIKRPKLYGI